MASSLSNRMDQDRDERIEDQKRFCYKGFQFSRLTWWPGFASAIDESTKRFGSARLPPYILFMVHVGIGYDVHELVAGRKLILGGVEIPHPKGLDGHSDADVLLHAICDAVLGALGEEDIGHFFPTTDPRWRGAPSKVFLQEAAAQVSKRYGK